MYNSRCLADVTEMGKVNPARLIQSHESYYDASNLLSATDRSKLPGGISPLPNGSSAGHGLRPEPHTGGGTRPGRASAAPANSSRRTAVGNGRTQTIEPVEAEMTKVTPGGVWHYQQQLRRHTDLQAH